MKITKVGVLIKQEHTAYADIRGFIECCIINNDDNSLNMGEGFHINKILNIGEMKTENLSNITVIADTWGYIEEFDICNIEAKKNHYDLIVDVDSMEDSDYFVLITLFEKELLKDEFQININDREGQLVYISSEKYIGSDDITNSLISRFNLYDNIDRRFRLLEFCDTTPKPVQITKDQFMLIVADLIYSIYKAEKPYHGDSIITTLIIDRELAKYLVSLM